MSEPFVAEIRIFPYTFAPRGWAFCNGQLLTISENSALFSILGTTFGGDGQTTFGLPDLRNRVPIHPGNGPGLSSYRLGQMGGSEPVTLTAANHPAHTHTVTVMRTLGTTDDPAGLYLGGMRNNKMYIREPDPSTFIHMSGSILQTAGGSQGHENRQPALGLHFCISLFGIYPSRS